MAKISKTESGYQDPGEKPKEQVESRDGNWLSRTIRSIRRSKKGRALDDAKMKNYEAAKEIANVDRSKIRKESLEKHESYMVEYAIAAAVNKDYKMAEIFAKSAGFYSSGAYEEIVMQAVRKGDIDEAVKLAEQMPDDELGFKEGAYRLIILCSVDEGLVNDQVLMGGQNLGNSGKTLEELAEKTGRPSKTYRDAVRFVLRLREFPSIKSELSYKKPSDLGLAKKLRDQMSAKHTDYNDYKEEVDRAISEYETNQS